MSAPHLPQIVETEAEPTELVIRRLVRAIDFAEGFWLGFAKSNLREQRNAAAAACKSLLDALNISLVEIELENPVEDLLPVLRMRLEAEGQSADTGRPNRPRKLAIFVYGLEHSISSSDAYPPVLSSLNLDRELFRRELPHPLVIWLPDYALTALARNAPDFWAWRSGLYEFPPEPDLAAHAFELIRDEPVHVGRSLSEQAKRGRLMLLKGLLADYCELGGGIREREAQGVILLNIGLIYYGLGELAKATQAYEDSLKIANEQNNKYGAASLKHNLGVLSSRSGEYEKARRLFQESLTVKRESGDRVGVAATLHALGLVAQSLGEYAEAKRLYEESFSINREIDNKADMAATLNQLGMMAQLTGDYSEVRRLYEESLSIKHDVGDRAGMASTLNNLGIMATRLGDYTEARRLYEESLSIKREVGDRGGMASTLHQLGMIAQRTGDYPEARRLYGQSLNIVREVGIKEGEALGYAQLGLLDELEGKYKEALEHTKKAEELMRLLGNRSYVERITQQRKRLEAKAAAEN